MRAARLAITATLLATGACGGPEEPPEQAGEPGLARLTLRPQDVPEGLVLDETATGRVDSLREALPPQAAAPQLPPLPRSVRRAFVEGSDTVYAGGDVPGPRSITSSALRFADERSAAVFLSYLREVQSDEITLDGRAVLPSELNDAPGLGEEGYSWHARAPGWETSGCSWRRHDLVLTLTLGGPLGLAPPERALELARVVDARLGQASA